MVRLCGRSACVILVCVPVYFLVLVCMCVHNLVHEAVSYDHVYICVKYIECRVQF